MNQVESSKDANSKSSEILYNLLKSCNYENIHRLKPNSFAYLFGISETRHIFELLVNNAGNGCYLSSDELNRFIAKSLKGQIIYDMNELQNMVHMLHDDPKERRRPAASLMNNQSDEEDENDDDDNDLPEDYDGLCRATALMEKELRMIDEQNKIERLFATSICNQQARCKRRDALEAVLKENLSAEATSVKSQTKAANNSLNKAALEFNAKFSNDQGLYDAFAADISHIESGLNTYVANERLLLERITKLTTAEVSVCPDDGTNDSDKATSEREDVATMLKEMVKCEYRNSMQSLFLAKLDFQSTRRCVDEMKRIKEHSDEFLRFDQSQLADDVDGVRTSMEREIEAIEARIATLKDNYRTFSAEMVKCIGQVATAKAMDIVAMDMDVMQCKLHMFASRQGKLMRLVRAQKQRLDAIDQLGALKLADLDALKECMEQLVDTGSSFYQATTTTTTAAADQSSYLNNTTMVNKTSSSHKQHASSSSYDLFSQSMTSKFSSTMIASNSMPALLPHIADDEASALVHKFNQFLIGALTAVESLCGPAFVLKRPISINLIDNLDCFADAVTHFRNDANAKSRVAVKNRKLTKRVNALVSRAMEYLYDTVATTTTTTCDAKSTSSSSRMLYDLSKIKNLKMPKMLWQAQCDLEAATSELHELFGKRIFQPCANYKSQLANSKLHLLRRDIFVYFYTKSHQMSSIVEQLNSHNF